MDQETGVSRVRTGTPGAPARAELRTDSERSIDEIRQNIEHKRSEITDTVDQLSEKFKETFDWKKYVGEYPFVALGGATVIGFFVARKLVGKKRSDTDELIRSVIRLGADALRPPKKGIFATVAALSGKYLLDQYQKYQEEQSRQTELQEQMEQLEALQLMQQKQFGTQTSGYPVSQNFNE
jgi:ElaB/YqjD/DUF883 family membrane-anchored ribosome-binding protein